MMAIWIPGAAAAGVAAVLATMMGGSEQRPGEPAAARPMKAAAVTRRASGAFDVKVARRARTAEGAGLGRMSLDKQFRGDLAAASKGEMLTASPPVKGSAVYVAVEQVTGTLHGRSGSFMLHHTGIMSRGTPQLTITVVPDSGTGELEGLTGTMTITIHDGKHTYDFDYMLAPGR